MVERQTHYLEGVASAARAGSNPAIRTIKNNIYMLFFFMPKIHKNKEKTFAVMMVITAKVFL